MAKITVPDVVGAVDVRTANYSGHRFSDFYPRRSAECGPGWYVFGRNPVKYGKTADSRGNYIMLCAQPDIRERAHPHYNGRVRRGWHTKREAQRVADYLNTLGQV